MSGGNSGVNKSTIEDSIPSKSCNQVLFRLRYRHWLGSACGSLLFCTQAQRVLHWSLHRVSSVCPLPRLSASPKGLGLGGPSALPTTPLTWLWDELQLHITQSRSFYLWERKTDRPDCSALAILPEHVSGCIRAGTWKIWRTKPNHPDRCCLLNTRKANQAWERTCLYSRLILKRIPRIWNGLLPGKKN